MNHFILWQGARLAYVRLIMHRIGRRMSQPICYHVLLFFCLYGPHPNWLKLLSSGIAFMGFMRWHDFSRCHSHMMWFVFAPHFFKYLFASCVCDAPGIAACCHLWCSFKHDVLFCFILPSRIQFVYCQMSLDLFY